MGLRRGHTARPLEWLVEKGIFVVSLSAIVMIFLIFLFIAREALPVLLGNTNDSLVQKTIPVEAMDRLTPKQLSEYLGLTEKEFAGMADNATWTKWKQAQARAETGRRVKVEKLYVDFMLP